MTSTRFVQPSKTSKTHRLLAVETIDRSGWVHPHFDGQTERATTACGSVFLTSLITDTVSAKGICGLCARGAK